MSFVNIKVFTRRPLIPTVRRTCNPPVHTRNPLGLTLMNESELSGYRRAGEIYGRLRSVLPGGKLTMTCDPEDDYVDYTWTVRRKRKQLKLSQGVSFRSVIAADEWDTLVKQMAGSLTAELGRAIEEN